MILRLGARFGARRGDILRQILIEAVLLSDVGGLIGVATGSGAAKLPALLAEWPTLISLDAVLIVFVFSSLVGIFFGFFPARKASN